MSIFKLPKEFTPGYSTTEKPTIPVTFWGNGDAWLFKDGNYGTLNHENVGALIGVTPKADYLYCDGVSNSGVTLPGTASRFSSSAFTVVYDIKIDSYTANDRIIDCKSVWNDAAGWSLEISNNQVVALLSNGSTSTSIGVDSWAPWIDDGQITLIVRYDGTTIEVWTNHGGYGSRAVTLNTSSTDLSLFKYNATTGLSPEGSINYLSIYDYAIQDAKVDLLLRKGLYQDLEPSIPAVYFPSEEVAGGGTTGGRFIPGVGYVSGYNPGIIPGGGYVEGAAVAGGGTTPTSNNTTFQWNLIESIQNNSTIQWDLLTAISNNSNLQWNLLGSISNSSTLQWSLIEAVSNDSTLQWNLESSVTSVSSNSTLQWSLLESISNNSTLQWDLESALANITNSVDLRWSMAGKVSQLLTSNWDLLESVGVDSTLKWDLTTAITNSLESQWSLLGQTSNDLQIQWDSIATTEGAIELRWTLLSDLTPISTTRILMLRAKNKTLTLRAKNKTITLRN